MFTSLYIRPPKMAATMLPKMTGFLATDGGKWI